MAAVDPRDEMWVGFTGLCRVLIRASSLNLCSDPLHLSALSLGQAILSMLYPPHISMPYPLLCNTTRLRRMLLISSRRYSRVLHTTIHHVRSTRHLVCKWIFFLLFYSCATSSVQKDAVEDAGCKVPIAVELDKCTAHTLQIQA